MPRRLYAGVVLISFTFSAAPHLDVICSAWDGWMFILRDRVQTRFGHSALSSCKMPVFLPDRCLIVQAPSLICFLEDLK